MAPAPKPEIRFNYSKSLHKRAIKVLDAIDSDSDPTVHRDDVSAVINELANAGMQYFFLDSLKKMKMGMVANQAAGLGVSSTLRIMGPMIRNIVGHADKKQLRILSKRMRTMMG